MKVSWMIARGHTCREQQRYLQGLDVVEGGVGRPPSRHRVSSWADVDVLDFTGEGQELPHLPLPGQI